MTTSASPHTLTFQFDGRPIAAVDGQSIAAALYAHGLRVFSRSFKYHRPRGLFCISGDCANCLMQVDGRPNVRTCTEPARGGQVVASQNAWPSLNFDLLRIVDRLSSLFPVGFYYRRFYKPRWLWPLYEWILRHLAGLGRIDVHEVQEGDTKVEHLHADVCVIGGGPAGLATAQASAEAGIRVLLLEQTEALGGHLLYQPDPTGILATLLAAAADSYQVRTATTAFGIYEGNLVAAMQGHKLLKIRAKEIVVCTGGRQQPFLFANNDVPGIFLGRGVQRLARQHGVSVGQRAVVLTDCDDGMRLASDLHALNIEVVAVIDRRPASTSAAEKTYFGSTVVRANGNKALKSVVVAKVGLDGVIDESARLEIACDLLCLVSRLVPANELLRQAGMSYRYEDGTWRPDRDVPGITAAGVVARTVDLESQIEEGRERGRQAAARVRGDQPALRSEPARSDPVDATPLSLPGKCFVCLCEDVTDKDLRRAVEEGFDGIETLKRYSTVSMGVCQGKMCGLQAMAICAAATGKTIPEVGATTSRPPAVAVELRVLAAGQRHHLVRRTPLHHWHHAAGAQWMDAGAWRRPENYGDPAAEVRAVRTHVGLIDVSTLGKLEILGPDAVEFLERIYLNAWGDVKEGRARYAAMCNEEGILFDDGVGGRLNRDRFYLTTTSGNADAVYHWMLQWRATWRLNVTIVNLTAGMAAMNLAGPRARETLTRMTDLDLSPTAFPYMSLRLGQVAGSPCRIFRIGFVGELGYEIHCPSAFAWHVWSALYEAGAEFNLRLFGVEAQRILRLEKGHAILGQDTDALSNPLEAGMEGLVRFAKQTFHGRGPLERLRDRGPRARLVGFCMADSDRVPPEGSQVVENGRPVGRVTSSRFSPTLEKSIGLAWVPSTCAEPGSRFLIHLPGGDFPALVSKPPFYDAEGSRIRS